MKVLVRAKLRLVRAGDVAERRDRARRQTGVFELAPVEGYGLFPDPIPRLLDGLGGTSGNIGSGTALFGWIPEFTLVICRHATSVADAGAS